MKCQECGHTFEESTVSDEQIRVYGEDYDFSPNCPMCGSDELTMC